MGNNTNTQIMDPIQQQQQEQNLDFNGIQTQQQQPHQSKHPANNKNVHNMPFVKIIEQPAGKALRFRYECEGRSAGSIPGVNSTPENKTYPTIEIVGYKGRAVVVVSCVTKDKPYRPHPHNLVGKDGCKKGVCKLEINSETMKAVFSNLGIQCVKKKDIEAALKVREEICVDPYKTGFTHRFQPSSIDLNAVRLCFQVFMKSDQKGRFTQPIAPVVSEPIFDKKAMSDLVICRLCSCSATVLGNTQIFLFCEKVAKEDISVRFYEQNNDQTVWEAYGEFQHTDVHKQTGIAFKTPRYHKIDITEPAKVFIQLKRPSDGVTSEALPFEYIPLDSDPAHLRRKRQKTNGDPVHLLLQQQENQHQNHHQDGRQANMNCWNRTNFPVIKNEPRDTSPQPLSPSSEYNKNTTSPYNMSTTVGTQQGISTSQQYNTTYTGGGNNLNLTMDFRDYYAFGQQLQHQQQYLHNNFGGAGATQWDAKFIPVPAARNDNLNNLNDANTFGKYGVLPTGGPRNGTSGTCYWNLTSNHTHPQHHLMQQQYQQHQVQNEGAQTNKIVDYANTAVSAANANNGNNSSNNEHGLSNLLTLDSEQLVCINSEDQQMLQLNSEDLQISNISLSI